MNLQTDSAQILDLVRKFFPGIAEPDLQQEIAEEGSLMSFNAGETIMEVGKYVRMVPLLIEGSIKVVREDEAGNELFLYYLMPGESCTMTFSCCMMHKKSEMRTTAVEDTVLIGLPIQKVDQWMTKYQSWKNFVMQSYDTRMLELVKTIDSIAFKKMDERLMEYLEQKVETTGSNQIHTTHQEIAYDLNASREAVSRLLKQMEKEGLVELGRNLITLQ